mgnify:CR=1 FL=1
MYVYRTVGGAEAAAPCGGAGRGGAGNPGRADPADPGQPRGAVRRHHHLAELHHSGGPDRPRRVRSGGEEHRPRAAAGCCSRCLMS